jgi:hypothetical protein
MLTSLKKEIKKEMKRQIKREILKKVLEEKKEEHAALKEILEISQFPFGYEKFRSYLTIKKKGEGFATKFEPNSSQVIFDNFLFSQYKQINKINFTNAKFRQNGTSTNTCGWGLYAGLSNRYDVAFLGKDEGNINALQKMVDGFCEDLKLAFGLNYRSKEHELYFPDYKFTIYFRISNNRSGGVRGLTLGCIINDELGHRNFSSGDTEAFFTGKNSVKIGIGTPYGISNLLYVAYKNRKNNNFLFTNWVEMKENESSERQELAEDTLDYLAKIGLNEIPIEKKYWFAEKWEAARGETFDLQTRFNQEYPPNIDIGFEATAENCFVEAKYINFSFGNQNFTKHKDVIIGIDIAGGGDKSIACFRFGKRAEFIELKHKAESFGSGYDFKAEQLINSLRDIGNYNILSLNIDSTGQGINFVDILKNKMRNEGLNYNLINAVHFASRVEYRVKSGEVRKRGIKEDMYFRLREWLMEDSNLKASIQPLKVIQEELLATEITSREGEEFIISKEKIKEKINRSPDYADALALTFAPVKQKIYFSLS